MNTRLVLIFALICNITFAQPDTSALDKSYDQAGSLLRERNKDSLMGWKKGGLFSLTGSNVGLVNWAAGGQNSISINSRISLFANMVKPRTSWDNSLELGYGLLRQGQLGWLKSDDKVDLSSKYGLKLSDHLYGAALLNFRTQFTDGFNYPNDSVRISKPFAPAYMLNAIGVDYKPNKKISFFLSPLTSKLTLVNDQTLADNGAFGVTAGKRSRYEMGSYLRISADTKLTETIKFTSRLDLFSNYLDKPQNIDVNWETMFQIKLWKLLALTFSTHLIYDEDIDIQIENTEGEPIGFGPRVQFKHVMGFGLSWKIES